ncbi:MAG TPA: hypothetical protein VGC99_00260 [Candidatus Tectomicrobia bacterium]
MKQPMLGENEAGCTCSGWVDNVPLLNTLLLLGKTHGQAYRGTSFRFCPWCGQPLTQVSGQRDEGLLEKYRRRIEDDFFAEDQWGIPQTPNMLVAARSVTDYRQRTGDSLGTLDLMLTFVETGTRFTNEFGDIDEPFYEGLELMFDDFRELLLAHPDLYAEADLAQRLAKLARDAGWMGWGYGDYVSEQVAEIQQHFGDI